MRSSHGVPRGRSRRVVQPNAQLGGPPSVVQGGRGSNINANDHDRRMELIASVSRSTGLEKDGDLLKGGVVQEEFRTFIDKKLRIFWDLYEAGSPIKSQTEPVQKRKRDNQENILILFRKLREGVFASGRKDGFALEVYETSLYLSVVFDSPVQTTSILSRLVPDIYPATPTPQPFRLTTILILLLHQLVVSFPSQKTYLEQIRYVVPNLLERPSPAYLWISSLARSLRTFNFVQFERLSHPDAYKHLLPLSHPTPSLDVKAIPSFQDLPQNAVHALVSRLRLKARDEAWIVVRNAYRELSSSDETQVWLGKRLLFDNFGSEATVVRFDEWVREKCRDKQLRPKEGVEGRWMLNVPGRWAFEQGEESRSVVTACKRWKHATNQSRAHNHPMFLTEARLEPMETIQLHAFHISTSSACQPLAMLTSRSLPAFLFNTDLTDCLLMTLPDFQSLQGFISSSKFVYSIFRSRQHSILGAVAHNQLGPALPQAMRLVRCLGASRSSRLAYELRREVSLSPDFTITSAQARLLREHAAIVRALEDLFSWREKDPRSRTSRLSAAESLRFQQSVYMFWFLAATWGPETLVDEKPGYSHDKHSQLKDSIVKRQTTFLSSFGESELQGVNEVHRFLLDLVKWASVKHTTRPTRSCLGFGDRDDIYIVWSGPAVTLDAFRGRWPSLRRIDSQWYGTWRAMTHAFLAAVIGSITAGRALSSTRQRFVLDDYFLKTIDCNRCQGSPSLSRRDSLWSFCNWEYMILAITPSHLRSCLSFEGRRPFELLVAFTDAIESTPYPQFIEEVFDIRSERYKDWKKDEWLCTRCMIKFLSDNIQAWLDKRITQANATTN